MNRGMSIGGISYYVPERAETNEDLIRDFGTWTPEKIYKKTGVNVRHIADPNLPVSHYMQMAGDRFFEEHPGIARDSIDMLVCCCEARDYVLPATACIVHEKLGLRKNCGAIDYDLGCSGYIYGLAVCRGFIAAGIADRVLFITGDEVTRYINKKDKSIRTIFGDVFTATLLERTDEDRVYSFDLGTDGSGFRDIIIEAGETALPKSAETAVEETNRFGNVHCKENLFMDGRRVLDFSMSVLPASVDVALSRAGLTKDDIDLVVFHQASKILLESVRDHLGFAPEKFIIALENTGNTASSSIPLTLAHCLDQGLLKPGMKVLVSGFGVGLSWGTAVIEWSAEHR